MKKMYPENDAFDRFVQVCAEAPSPNQALKEAFDLSQKHDST